MRDHQRMLTSRLRGITYFDLIADWLDFAILVELLEVIFSAILRVKGLSWMSDELPKLPNLLITDANGSGLFSFHDCRSDRENGKISV